MAQPRSYIVRVYRRGFVQLSGLVEDVAAGTEHTFKTAEELHALLGALSRHRASPGNHPSTPSTREKTK
jgi:hypothetical protein